MFNNFPEWSDLANISNETRNTWQNETAIRLKYRRYFDGTVFKDTVPVEIELNGDTPPLLYPVGVNLVKMICVSQADSEFGEWEDDAVTFGVNPDEDVDSTTTETSKMLSKIVQGSNFNSALWEIALERRIYGGSAIKISPDMKSPGFIRWSHVPLNSFYPVWDPDDINDLLEVYVVIDMTPEQAYLKYGIEKSTSLIVKRVEHWTKFSYENKVDGKRIDAFSGINPWGVVPFVYIPHMRSTHWWGDALTEDLIPVQDELNMRLGDLGEVINYNAHPVRFGLNLPKSFNTKNFQIGPAAMWDLGRTIGSSPAPEVGLLEAKNPIPSGTFEYLNFVYDWGRTSSFSPPVAFGEDDGGGQRSGATLEIRMWPLIKSLRRSRTYLAEGLIRAQKITAAILRQKQFTGVSPKVITAMANGRVVPHFADIMPKDHVAAVDEVVKLMSTNPPTVSLPTSQKILGRGVGEVSRIRTMIGDKELMDTRNGPSTDQDEAIAGKATPQPGGNND